MRAIFVRSKGTYGRIRIVAELRNQGDVVNHKRVRRLMKEEGLVVATPRPWKRTTVSDPALPVAENLLNRQFSPATPNQVWAGDITCIATAEGWLYLAVILDLYSRKVVGWAVADHMRTVCAWRPWSRRWSAGGLVPAGCITATVAASTQAPPTGSACFRQKPAYP